MTASSCYASLRLTMIGPLPSGTSDKRTPIGGTIVSFDALVRYLKPQVAICEVIDTAPRANGRFLAALGSLTRLLMRLGETDIVTMHFSDRAAVTLAPVVWALCKVSGKPTVFRQFGGEFDRTYAQLPAWRKRLLDRTIFRSDAIFLQTKSMIRAFSPLSDRLHWFPTARARADGRNRLLYAGGEAPELRCLFIGHVSKDKGALRAVEAVLRNPKVRLDIYGPLVGVTEAELRAPRVTYRGLLAPDEVSKTMCEYDVLLFPTMHKGEGYPGVLVEAAMVGLPIIASRWRSLPEMFSEGEVLFVPPGDEEALAAALEQVVANGHILKSFSERLLDRAPDFDAHFVFAQFLEVCARLASPKAAN